MYEVINVGVARYIIILIVLLVFGYFSIARIVVWIRRTSTADRKSGVFKVVALIFIA